MEIIVQSYPVDILTSHYRVYGEIRTRGDPSIFLNDQAVSTLTVYDATLIPLRPGVRVGAMMMDELYIPKSEPQIITLGDYEPVVRPLPKQERLICLTDTYLLRGTFHMGPETRVEDVFYALPGPFFSITHVDIFALYPLAIDVKARSELGYLRGLSVRAFYSQPVEAGAGG